MTRRAALAALIPVALRAAQRKPQPPEVQLLDASAHVEEGRILIDGHVKNVSDRPIRKLNIIYEILESDKNVLTRQQGAIDAEELAPGEETAFSAQIAHHARAISFRLEFEDGSGRELRFDKGGPFPIEQ